MPFVLTYIEVLPVGLAATHQQQVQVRQFDGPAVHVHMVMPMTAHALLSSRLLVLVRRSSKGFGKGCYCGVARIAGSGLPVE